MTQIVAATIFLVALLVILTSLVSLARALLVPDKAVNLHVNGLTDLPSRTGRKLLTALAENGVLVPSACAGAGTCGLCRVRIPEGGPDPLPVETARLTRPELRAGVHLACQVTVRDDMTLEIDEALIDAKRRMLTVVSAQQLTPLIREVVLAMPTGETLAVRAGSYLQISAPPFAMSFSDIPIPPKFEAQWKPLRGLSVGTSVATTRAYSIANRPSDTADGRLVLNVRLALPPPSALDAPPGVVSSWLFLLGQGDEVEVSGPFGTFGVRDTHREMVFIGGGVGMAPLRAMIFEQLEERRTTRKMTFWYGARSRADLYYAEDLTALASEHSNFDWTVAMSAPLTDDGWNGATGFVHTVVHERYLRDHPAPEECEYYLCGPPLMIRAVLSMLYDLGVEPDHIFNDDFGV